MFYLVPGSEFRSTPNEPQRMWRGSVASLEANDLNMITYISPRAPLSSLPPLFWLPFPPGRLKQSGEGLEDPDSSVDVNLGYKPGFNVDSNSQCDNVSVGVVRASFSCTTLVREMPAQRNPLFGATRIT